jgi:hypothetical protein
VPEPLLRAAPKSPPHGMPEPVSDAAPVPVPCAVPEPRSAPCPEPQPMPCLDLRLMRRRCLRAALGLGCHPHLGVRPA